MAKAGQFCSCQSLETFVEHCIMAQKNVSPEVLFLHQIVLPGEKVTVAQSQTYLKQMLSLNFRPTRSISSEGNLKFSFSVIGLASDQPEPMDVD